MKRGVEQQRRRLISITKKFNEFFLGSLSVKKRK